MPIKIFLSYVPADKVYAEKMKRWAKRKKMGAFDIVFLSSEDKGVRTRRGRVIKPKLERKILEADFLVVIVGNYNKSHPWQRYEAFASTNNVERYYTRIPYTDDPLPEAMQQLTRIAYNPNAIDKILREKLNPSTATAEGAEEGTPKTEDGELVLVEVTNEDKPPVTPPPVNKESAPVEPPPPAKEAAETVDKKEEVEEKAEEEKKEEKK